MARARDYFHDYYYPEEEEHFGPQSCPVARVAREMAAPIENEFDPELADLAVYTKLVRKKALGPRLRSGADVVQFIQKGIADADREYLIAIFLNTRHEVIGYHVLAIGGVGGVEANPAMLFKVAMLANASAIIIVHNHPSGNADPSNQDLMISHRLREVGEIMGIAVLDHVVVGENGYASIAERGWI